MRKVYDSFCKYDGEYIHLKKQQYMDVAERISEIIQKSNYPENEGGFMLAKKWLRNNEQLSSVRAFGEAGRTLLNDLSKWIPVFISFILGLLTNYYTAQNGFSVVTLPWVLFLLIILLGYSVEIGLKCATEKIEKLHIRILDEMTFCEYEVLIKERRTDKENETKQEDNQGTQGQMHMKRMKSNRLRKKCFLCHFVKRNGIVTALGIVAFVYCCICSICKGSETWNISNSIVRSLGDLFYNICISIIAAYVFLIFQAWLSFRREGLVEKYTKSYIRLYLLKDCKLLQMQLELIMNGQKDEKELNQSIALVCERIQEELFLCTTKYREGLSDDLYENIDALFFDNEFYLIEKRARGQLTNMSMKEILQGYGVYGRMQDIIKEIADTLEN